MSAKNKMLFDPSVEDMFGQTNEEYHAVLQAFSEEFAEALYWKGRDSATNLLAAYGAGYKDPSVFIELIRSAFRFAIAFAVVNGYVELAEAAVQAVGGEAVEESDALVLPFPTGEAQ